MVSVYPMQRARQVTPDALQEALAAENPSAEGSVMEQIRDNQWLGSEFLMWLLYGTTNGRSDYHVTCDGPAAAGESFVAYLDNRFLLSGQGNEGAQKVTVVGPQDRFEEVRVALRQGKEIGEATIHMEKLEHQWRLTLKGSCSNSVRSNARRYGLKRGLNWRMNVWRFFTSGCMLLKRGCSCLTACLPLFWRSAWPVNGGNAVSKSISGWNRKKICDLSLHGGRRWYSFNKLTDDLDPLVGKIVPRQLSS